MADNIAKVLTDGERAIRKPCTREGEQTQTRKRTYKYRKTINRETAVYGSVDRRAVNGATAPRRNRKKKISRQDPTEPQNKEV